MKDIEIMKALELCSREDNGGAVCPNCPAREECYGEIGIHALEKAALDLIKRQQEYIEELEVISGVQQAEIERLKMNEVHADRIVEQLEAEIKEFPEASLAHYRGGLYKAIEIVKREVGDQE